MSEKVNITLSDVKQLLTKTKTGDVTRLSEQLLELRERVKATLSLDLESESSIAMASMTLTPTQQLSLWRAYASLCDAWTECIGVAAVKKNRALRKECAKMDARIDSLKSDVLVLCSAKYSEEMSESATDPSVSRMPLSMMAAAIGSADDGHRSDARLPVTRESLRMHAPILCAVPRKKKWAAATKPMTDSVSASSSVDEEFEDQMFLGYDSSTEDTLVDTATGSRQLEAQSPTRRRMSDEKSQTETVDSRRISILSKFERFGMLEVKKPSAIRRTATATTKATTTGSIKAECVRCEEPMSDWRSSEKKLTETMSNPSADSCGIDEVFPSFDHSTSTLLETDSLETQSPTTQKPASKPIVDSLLRRNLRKAGLRFKRPSARGRTATAPTKRRRPKKAKKKKSSRRIQSATRPSTDSSVQTRKEPSQTVSAPTAITRSKSALKSRFKCFGV